MQRPRFRFKIRGFLIVVVLASLLLTLFVAQRNRNQRLIALQRARADYENAKLTCEVNEIALLEYTHGVYVHDLATVKTEIALAESDLRRAADQLAWSQLMLESGLNPVPPVDSDREALELSKLALERAQTKLTTLERYTRDRTVKELQSEVDKAKADLAAKAIDYAQIKAAVARHWW
jgi:HAMP domain-containing protein